MTKAEQRHDLVVIGGSAGAVPVLVKILERLPEDFPAPILVVLHRSGRASHLENILARSSRLACCQAEDALPLERGRVYLAPNNQHLLVGSDHVHLSRGPRENGFRPSIDPLFRSAAVTAGNRSLGVILSGLLDDGASGARALKLVNGRIAVQDPAETDYPDLPRAAISAVGEPDFLGNADGLADWLTEMVAKPAGERVEASDELKLEVMVAGLERASIRTEERLGELTPFSCPDCKGVLWEIEDGPLLRYRCHTGHAYTANTLLESQTDALERRLYETLKDHRERSALLRHLADKDMANRAHWLQRAEDLDDDAATVESMLTHSRAA
ncbi:chemotaxis protein CheB [Pacificimonas flava]|uniref:protein-glutamate methylesterase n=2 Tax=Pacificimonas TaxID=1960290 RepID=A0A219B0P6_9SPHN|nr:MULTISPECIES: chemotaxis protein CheB [Pacificimonas]MBZ6379606.1 chemotaxis protein CheB [Pacificimonas aurantium]OWV31922.1 chemotaxis protein CheB [Pacificimonas flava]